MYQYEHAAMTKYHRLGGLNNRSLFSHTSGASEFEIRVLEHSGSGESSLPGLQTAIVSSQNVSSCNCVVIYRRERRTNCLISLPRRILILPHNEGPSLMTSSQPNCLLKTPSPNTITLRVRASTYEIWGTQFSSQHKIFPKRPIQSIILQTFITTCIYQTPTTYRAIFQALEAQK